MHGYWSFVHCLSVWKMIAHLRHGFFLILTTRWHTIHMTNWTFSYSLIWFYSCCILETKPGLAQDFWLIRSEKSTVCTLNQEMGTRNTLLPGKSLPHKPHLCCLNTYVKERNAIIPVQPWRARQQPLLTSLWARLDLPRPQAFLCHDRKGRRFSEEFLIFSDFQMVALPQRSLGTLCFRSRKIKGDSLVLFCDSSLYTL